MVAPMDRRKVVALRLLAEPQPVPDGLQLLTLDALGQEAFNQVMLRASEGDPYDTSTAESAEEDFRELVEAAGTAFDPGPGSSSSTRRAKSGLSCPRCSRMIRRQARCSTWPSSQSGEGKVSAALSTRWGCPSSHDVERVGMSAPPTRATRL